MGCAQSSENVLVEVDACPSSSVADEPSSHPTFKPRVAWSEDVLANSLSTDGGLSSFSSPATDSWSHESPLGSPRGRNGSPRSKRLVCFKERVTVARPEDSRCEKGTRRSSTAAIPHSRIPPSRVVDEATHRKSVAKRIKVYFPPPPSPTTTEIVPTMKGGTTPPAACLVCEDA